MEMAAIGAVEKGGPKEEALEILNQAIQLAPLYPSPLNNRAQIYRLLRKPDEAMEDLSRAIELATESDFPLVRRQALAQRGWLHYGHWEDYRAAFKDFEEAAALGCEEAKQMAVRCNPYARLCSLMMQEMLGKLYYSDPSSQ